MKEIVDGLRTSIHTLRWIRGAPAFDREGRYLVLLSKENCGSRIHSCTVRRIANGFLTIVGMQFGHDIIEDECAILAYCKQPDYEEIEP